MGVEGGVNDDVIWEGEVWNCGARGREGVVWCACFGVYFLSTRGEAPFP